MKKALAAVVVLGAFLWVASAAHAYIETFDSGNISSATYPGWTTYTIGTPGYPGAA